MKTDESNPQHWFFLAAERLRAADVLYAQSGSTYSGIEIYPQLARIMKACANKQEN